MDPHSTPKAVIGVFTTSPEFIVKVWDDTLASMTGINAEDTVGKHITGLVPDLEARGLLGRFERVRDFGTTEVLAPAFHKYLIPCRPSVPSRRFEEMRQLVTISALYNDDEIDGLMIVLEDVTERMEKEQDLAEQLKDPDAAVRLHAAKAISNSPDALHSGEVEPVINALSDKNWRVRRTLVDSLSKRAAPDALASLLQAVREDHFDFGLLNGALQVLRSTSVDTTETLLDFLRSDDHDLRMQAALALGQLNKNDAVAPLLVTLNDEDANVRYHVIEALGNLRAGEATEPLLAIAESRDFFLSFAALDALKKIGDESVARRVSSLLNDDLLRDAAADTLGAVGDADSAERIVTFLNEGTLSAAIAARALSEIFDRREVGDSSGNEIARQVHSRILDKGKLALLGALTDSHPSPKVIRVAGWVDSEDIRQRLGSLVDDERFRKPALDALVAQGERAVDILIDKLQYDDTDLCSAVARALGLIDSSDGTEALASALQSKPRIAPSALEALGRSSSPKACGLLIELLASTDKTVRRAAANAVKHFANVDRSSVVELSSDSDPNVREAAIRVLGDSQTPEARTAVTRACSDADEMVRIAAFEQLDSFPQEEAVVLIAGALDDPVPGVRAAAVQALATFEGGRVIDLLNRGLRDPDAWVRYFAVRSLSAVGGGNETRELIRELSTSDPAEQVRVAAAEAIEGGRV